MNILLLTAHPNPEGLSHRFAQIAYEQLEKQGHSVELIDLYQDEKWAFGDLRFWADMEPTNDKELRVWREEKIKNTDKFIVFAPIWRSDLPAKVKSRYENVFTAKFAYRYTKNWPVGLLKGKRFQIVATCDGPGILYQLFPVPLWLIWRVRLKLPEIKLDGVKVFGSIRKRKKSKVRMDQLFDAVRRLFQK